MWAINTHGRLSAVSPLRCLVRAVEMLWMIGYGSRHGGGCHRYHSPHDSEHLALTSSSTELGLTTSLASLPEQEQG